MTFEQFLAVLRARIWVGVLIFTLVVGTTVTISLLLPKKYTAIATVVLELKPDPITASMSGNLLSSAVVATQVDVIQSERVSRRVVRDLRLTDNPQIRAQWLEATGGKGSIEYWLGQLFQSNLTVKPSRESSVIAVSYKASDPSFAAALANAFVQAYLATSVELRVDPAKQYSSFFDTRAKEAREMLESAQSKLSAYQREKGIIATDERLDVETSRLNELSSQLVMLQAVMAESGSRQTQARGGSADKLQEVLNNPLVAGLKSDLSRAQARLQELSARLGDAHPQVHEAKANIAELSARVEAETQRVAGGVGVTNTINRQREADVRGALEAQRNKVLRLKAVRDEGAVLMRDVESAQRAYDSVVARFNQTSLESQTTQGNANLLTSATPPIEHSSPKVALNTAVAIVLGFLLAVGTVLLREMLDRRVRSPQDVAAAMGLAVVGVLPKPAGYSFLGMKKPTRAQQRMLARLTAPGKAS
jgi:polysaccharide biosynthesis transport protein